MAGNNIPFDPKDSRYRKSNSAPVEKFGRKHSGAPGNPNSPKNATRDMRGAASGGGQGSGNASLQKAAGKRLFGGKPGAFSGHRSARDV